MAKNIEEHHRDRVLRCKDKVTKLTQQLELARMEAAREILVASEAKIKRSHLADWWKTSIVQIDRMIARAKAERK
jgi:hypothetical protein